MISIGDTIAGLKVVIDPGLSERKQIRFPRSRARRIQKKWRKRESNFRHVPRTEIYKVGDKLIMHPETYECIKRLVRDRGAQ